MFVAFIVAGILAERHYCAIVFGLPLLILLRCEDALQFCAIERIDLVELSLSLGCIERRVVAGKVEGLGALLVQLVQSFALNIGQGEAFSHLVASFFEVLGVAFAVHRVVAMVCVAVVGVR